MNFDAYRAVWDAQDAGRLPVAHAFTVAMALADRTDKTGETRQGVRTIAERMNLSRSTVQRALAAVLAAGVYTVGRPGTGHRAAVYVLASRGRDARPVDNVGLASHRRDAIASQVSDLASQNGAFSVPNAGLSYRTVNASLGISAQNPPLTPPADVPARVCQLRDRLNGGAA